MSRQLRRMAGRPSIPIAPDETEENYDPFGSRAETLTSKFEGLYVSSNSEQEHVSNSDVEDCTKSSDAGAKKSVQKRKRKNGRKRNKKSQPPNPTSQKEDDIDKLLKEVEAAHCSSQSTSQVNPTAKKVTPLVEIGEKIFRTRRINFDAENELDRKFGPHPDQIRTKPGRRPNCRVNRHQIVPSAYTFERKGLSMDMKRSDNKLFFFFKHNIEYQREHNDFLLSLKMSTLLNDIPRFMFERIANSLIVEGLICEIDFLFNLEDYDSADDLLIQAIAYMQYVAHPDFDITNYQCRLEYKYYENRALHILLLKYAYMLSNRACHRTALEIVKSMLNLDPSDPLAVVLILDGLAVRAREYKWLIDAYRYLYDTKSVQYMVNMKFSYAMALFHVAKKSKDPAHMKIADDQIKDALLAFPTVFKLIYKDVLSELALELRQSEFFTSYAEESTPEKLRHLIMFYVTFTKTQWYDRSITAWLARNAKYLADKYVEKHFILLATAHHYTHIRMDLFREYPPEIYRHFAIINSMSKLLVDGVVPPIKETFSMDPRPPEDTIRYSRSDNLQSHEEQNYRLNHLMEFFETLFPGNALALERQEPQE